MIAPRRCASHLLFAVTLLLAQQVLVAHPLMHGLGPGKDGITHEPSTPAERVACVVCMAGFASSAALPSAAQPLLAMPARVFEQALFAWEYHPPVTLAFSSRAPPQFL